MSSLMKPSISLLTTILSVTLSFSQALTNPLESFRGKSITIPNPELHLKSCCQLSSESSGENRIGSNRHLLTDFKNYFHILLKDTWYFTASPARISRRSLCWLGGIMLVGGALYAYDQQILDAFCRNRENRVYKPLLQTGQYIEPLGHMGITNKYYFAGFAIGSVFKIRFLQEIAFQILESHLIAGLFKNVANTLVGRSRPFENRGPGYFKLNGGTSFPSGHASTSFQLATILSHHVNYRPFSVLCYGLATSIAVQRIDSKAHWPSDVFFAAVYGTVVSRTIINLHSRRKVKLIPSITPDGGSVGLNIILQL